MAKKMKKGISKGSADQDFDDFGDFESPKHGDLGNSEIDPEGEFVQKATLQIACALISRPDMFLKGNEVKKQIGADAAELASFIWEEMETQRIARAHLRDVGVTDLDIEDETD